MKFVSLIAGLTLCCVPVAVAQPTVVDERPAKERSHYLLSRLVFNCSYGIENIPDGAPGFDRIAQLGNELALAGLTEAVTVKRYVVLLNAQARLEGAAWSVGMSSVGVHGTGGGVAGQPEVRLRAKCEQAKMPSGWFATAELDNNYSPLVTEMTVTYAGKEYTVRSVYSTPVELDAQKKYAKPVTVGYINAAMSKANAALIAQIKGE